MRYQSKAAIAAVVVTVAASFLLADFAQAAPGPSGYHVVKTIPIGGNGRWDYCVVDSAARRVYVSHGTHVVVLDADSGAVVGDIPDTLGVHGIALATDLGRGFITAGRANTVIIFDLKTLKTISHGQVGRHESRCGLLRRGIETRFRLQWPQRQRSCYRRGRWQGCGHDSGGRQA